LKISRTRIGSALVALMLTTAAWASALGSEGPRELDHVYVIVLESRRFDEDFLARAPYLRSLVQSQGLATNYLGVSHPSLPNYLAMIAGDDFSVRDDGLSCYASDLRAPCHGFPDETLVDQLERKHLTWSLYAEGIPAPGSLASQSPAGDNPVYVQRHNPFAYFDHIANDRTNPDRLQRLKPLDAFDADLANGPPSFSMIIPNLCNDGHGSPSCADEPKLIARSDIFVAAIVNKIRVSPNWSDQSAIIVAFDEDDAIENQAGAQIYGPHPGALVVTKCGGRMRSFRVLNHYSLLATIEDGFGLSRLRKAGPAGTMWRLFGQKC
jgi:phosphatidylinositol-3-phosphatase